MSDKSCEDNNILYDELCKSPKSIYLQTGTPSRPTTKYRHPRKGEKKFCPSHCIVKHKETESFDSLEHKSPRLRVSSTAIPSQQNYYSTGTESSKGS